MPEAALSLKQLMSRGGLVSLGKVLTVVAGVATNALLTRMLTPDEVGAYFLIFSLISVAVLLAQMGLHQAAVRYIAEFRGKGLLAGVSDVVLKSMMMVACAAVIAATLYWAFARSYAAMVFHSPLMTAGAGWLALWIIFTSLRTLAAECLRGFEAISRATLFEGLLSGVLFLAFVLWLWTGGHSATLNQVFVGLLLSAFVSMMFALFSLWRRAGRFARRQCITARELVKTALPLQASNIMIVFLSSFGLWLVGHLTSAADAAQYGAATRLVALAQFPLLALNAIVPPMVARMYAQNKIDEMERLLRWCASLAFFFGALFFLLFLIWGGDLLTLLFGPYYSVGKWILVMLALGILANAWAGFCGPALMMSGHQRDMMHLSLLSALAVIPTAWALGNIFGAVGIALAMSLGMALLHVLLWLTARKRLGVWTHAGLSLRGIRLER